MKIRTSLVVITAVLMIAPLGARQASPKPGLPAGVKLRSIGPVNTSGRIDDFAVGRIAGHPDAIDVATASGGVFKSVNGGTSWTPVFDQVDAMLSIGAIAVAKS